MLNEEYKIAIVGLGYVGLPLSLAFAKKYHTIGFDINKDRVDELGVGVDKNDEFTKKVIEENSCVFTSTLEDIKECNIYIITVPTPLKNNKEPDLSVLFNATKIIGTCLDSGNIVIYESTVYPGVTEEECAPILEKESGLTYNKDFFCGYSPERISPGRGQRELGDIIKITSGSNPKIADKIDELYRCVIKAGTHKVSSIRIAEAAKLVENTQRDVNIALINELAMMFDSMDINFSEILDAAATKWNFLDFKPGLVGGHCIGVDPYYLMYKSEVIGFKSDLILSSRNINNSVPSFIVEKTVKFLSQNNKKIKDANILILGYTFKENCSDTRNTKVQTIINKLNSYGCNISVYDPLIKKNHTNFVENPFQNNIKYDAILVAVSHEEFRVYKRKDYEKISDGELILLDIKDIVDNPTWKL